MTAARPSRQTRLTISQWDSIRRQVDLLDKIALLPSPLTAVMKNQDALELSEAQIAAFHNSHALHSQHMVDPMNEIIQRRVSLSEAALNEKISSNQILDE